MKNLSSLKIFNVEYEDLFDEKRKQKETKE